MSDPRRWGICSISVFTAALGLVGAFTALRAATYDTSWTYVYDAGLSKSGEIIGDNFRDVKLLPGGNLVCVGETRDSAFLRSPLIMQLSADGKALKNVSSRFVEGAGATSRAP